MRSPASGDQSAARTVSSQVNDVRVLGRSPESKRKYRTPITVGIVLTFAVLVLMRGLVIDLLRVESISMAPTLADGQYIGVMRLGWGISVPFIQEKLFRLSEPERGDVIVFKHPVTRKLTIKRLVGLSGDEVGMTSDVIIINGKSTAVPCWKTTAPFESCERIAGTKYLVRRGHSPYSGGRPQRWTVPVGYLFVIGDNRRHSNDSRQWGFVPIDFVEGRVVATY